MRFISALVSAVTIRGPAGVIAELGRVGDAVAHVVQPALVDQVDDQLHLVDALEVGHFGLIAGLDERLETGLHQRADAAAEHGLLAEKIGLGLFGDRRLDDAGAGAADAFGVGQADVEHVFAGPFAQRDQAGHARAAGELRPHQMARPLGATSSVPTPLGTSNWP